MTQVRGWCGVDVGTQGVRTVVADDAGVVLGAGRRALPSGRRGPDGRHEQEPDDWWAALVGSMNDAVTRSRRDHDAEIVAVSLDATSGTILVEDRHGRPRGPALMYDDMRATEQALAAERIGATQWQSLGYRMQPSWALPKAMWLREQAMLAPGDRITHQADHLLARLCGHPVPTDTSNALKTGADLRRVQWPDDVLAALGVQGLFPALVLPGTRIGTVGTAAAGVTGLTAGTVVKAGMTDGCAAQIASGALRAGRWSSALGTTLVVKGSTSQLLLDPSGAVYCHRHPDAGWLPGGASSSGAGALAAAFPSANDATLAALTATAEQQAAPDGFTYPLVGSGERFPFSSASARGELSRHATDDAARFSALCRSIAFVERLAYDTLALLGADTSGAVAFTGGAANNRWWNQLRCDLLGREVVIPASSEAALGMAILAAAGPGELTSTAERMVRVSRTLQPDPERHGEYLQQYQGFVAELTRRQWIPTDLGERLTQQVTA